MQTRLLRDVTTTMLVGSLAIFAAGCDDDPLEPEEHPEAGGVVILDEEKEPLAMSVGAGADFDNSITVPLDGALEVEVLFLNEDDPTNLDLAFLPDEDEGESLEVSIADETIAAFDFHGDHGDFEGLSAGTTTATIFLMHGNHSDFDSGDLTIIVE